MISAAEARAIELATLAAVPAQERIEDDGWILTANGGAVGRANSVTPLYAGVDPIAVKIDRAIAFYRSRDLAPSFRVSPFSRPEGLQTALAERGFSPREETSVETAAVDEVAGAAPRRNAISWTTAPGPDWLEVFLAASSDPEPLQRARIATLQRAEGSLFYSAVLEGRIAAVGVGAFDASGLVGLHGMRTAQAARRQGFARDIALAAAGHARDRGIERIYLQVEAANAPARALYASLGFAPAYSYAYWRAA